MERPVISVNGVNVYSDKTIDSVSGHLVMFTDGSYCNVRDWTVANVGPGYIYLGEPGNGYGNPMNTIVNGPLQFQVNALDVRSVQANVDIQVHEYNEIGVSVEGFESDVAAITVTQQGQSVLIQGPEQRGGGNSTISINGSGISIGGGSYFSGDMVGGRIIVGDVVNGRVNGVVIGGNAGRSNTRITVYVPIGAALTLADITGNTTIGDVQGPLNATVGAGDIMAGQVGATNINVRGSGDVDIREVLNRPVSINVMGSGDVQLGGQITMLNASVMGSGDVSHSGVAEMATLSVMGSGNIYVKDVTQRPSRNVMGSGRIRIGNW